MCARNVLLALLVHVVFRRVFGQLQHVVASEQIVVNADGTLAPSSTKDSVQDRLDVATPQPYATKLKFMHIPKTGGTSIDSSNLHLQQDQRAFESFMSRTYDRICQANASECPRGNAGDLYDESHAERERYSLFLRSYHMQYRVVTSPAGSACPDVHVPPDFSQASATYYADNSSRVFCVVRDPMRRFFSAYEMMNLGPCDAELLEDTTRRLIGHLEMDPFIFRCFFIPMVHFVYGAASQQASTQQYCTEILHQEDLNQEYDALMAKYGRGVKLPSKHLMHWTDELCQVNLSRVTQATKEMIYRVYQKDYEAFNYSRPF